MRRLVRFVMLVCVPLALVPVPAAASEAGNAGHSGRYLALGDSVPFGFNPLLNPNDATNFVGYPEVVAGDIQTRVANATCPGEATGGFISLTGTDNVCRPYRASFPLHINYETSQLDFALAFLRAHSDVGLVTITLGANDIFRLQKDCAAAHPGDAAGAAACFSSELPSVLGTMFQNLKQILGDIRATGYRGPLVGVTYYALDYNQPAGSIFLNQPMQAALAAFGGTEASGFTAWEATAFALGGGDSCAAGLLVKLPNGTCDVHPSPAGRDLLAAAVIQALPAGFSLAS